MIVSLAKWLLLVPFAPIDVVKFSASRVLGVPGVNCVMNHSNASKPIARQVTPAHTLKTLFFVVLTIAFRWTVISLLTLPWMCRRGQW